MSIKTYDWSAQIFVVVSLMHVVPACPLLKPCLLLATATCSQMFAHSIAHVQSSSLHDSLSNRHTAIAFGRASAR